MLLKKVTRNTVHAMKELGYLECDHPDIAVNMKTKEEINVMLNLAKEIIKVFRLKGILHKIEASEINKLIMDKKRELLDFQPITKAPTTLATLYHIPWLDKNKKHINFIKERAKIITYDCGNNIFEEGDEPKGIYIIISGMVKLKRSKPGLVIDHILQESEEKDNQIIYTDYMISGEIIGELNCLTNEPMKYSATCKTVVEDWTYKMQLKLCNINLKDIPKGTKTDIYDETVIYVILIHGAVEDCQLRKVYKAPFLIPITCHQIQGTEEITKVMIVQTPIDAKNFRWSTRTYIPSRKPSIPKASLYEGTSSVTNQQDNADQNSAEELCYTLINHNILMRRPSGTSAEGHYENVPHQAERPRKLLGRTETEYSLLHVPSTPRHPPFPEDEYEFLMPRSISSHTLQPPHLLMLPSEAHIFHL
ncbi:Sodium/hydrogen exchanger 10 [Pteropus alecto]|uniref:Sodium/hydrogen exchanger 10 n=1 Tax=Pteropus alecto TaxID=9402 RepID=L5L3E2_PTEAL|nr:Sodium/hydrogen exchanger 10 [Pteropus alecto]